MASEAEASCESYPNFAIICAFMEKFGELCGIGSIDFVELQKMLENNQEVSPELMNLHIKLLRKTKKNVTVERWERALVNMCHNYSSKDAWEIERFGYKKTRLEVKLRALKELLEMQFDYNTKFKNEVNKMSSDSLRAQPLGRDKLGRAYWFQTDNNYQIRIYKEDPDEETWHLIVKDRDGLLSLISELADGDLKISSDSALNEDSNSLSEKPFIDTGQSDNSNESKPKDQTAKAENKIMRNPELIVSVQKLETGKKVQVADSKSDSLKIVKVEDIHADIKVSKSKNETLEVAEKKKEPAAEIEEESSEEDDEEEEEDQDESEKKGRESEEVKRPMLRIKSLSELMEKPKETKKSNFLPGLPELTIIKKAKLDSSQITITRRSRLPPKEVQVSPAVESPLMIIKGRGSGSSNQSCNIMVSEEIDEPVMYVSGVGSGNDCQAGEARKVQENVVVSDEIEEPIMYFSGDGFGQCCSAGNISLREHENGVIVSEEIEEEVFYVFGEGSGEDCRTGNEKEQSTTQQLDESKSTEASTLQASKLNTSEPPSKVPIDSVNLDTIIDSKTDNNTNSIEESSDDNENQKDEIASPKKMQFFFGPGSLNIKPGPTISGATDANPEEVSKNNGSVLGGTEEENGEDKDASEDNRETKGVAEEDEVPSSECPESEGGEKHDNQVHETSKNESDNEQIEEEDLSGSKQDQEKEETIDSDEKEIEDEELKTDKIEDIPKDDTPVEEKNKAAAADDLTSKQVDSKNECLEEETASVNITENIQEKVDTAEEGNIPETDQKKENRTEVEEIEENIHKDEENSKEENDKDIEESGVLSDKGEEAVTRKCDKSAEINETTEKPERAKNITDDEKEDHIDKIEDNNTTQKVEDKSEESKVEDENDTTLEEADTIEKGKGEEKNDTKTPKEADKIEESKVVKKTEEIPKEADKIDKVEEKKDTPPKVGGEIKNAEVEKKKNKPLKVEEGIEESKIEGKKGIIPKEDTTAKSKAEKIKNKKGKVEIGKKKDTVKINDDEDEEIEENEPKNQEKKRKRVTRNTSSLNESIGEEDMNPRKKVPVEKNKKKGPQKVTKVNNKKEEDEEKAETAAVEVTETRSTRQTRQTRASAPVTKVQPAAPLKVKGKLKKTISQTSKSDEAESPAPLESVIVETDNSNTAVENPETDPLAVSEEELGTANQTVSSITSFSFDYNPNNPAAEESKRGLRKRGRDNLDDKPEPLDKGVKRPKMKGKRTVDQTLRKSVEERRQKVVNVSSDENELPKKEIKAKGGKKVPVKKKTDSSSVSESDSASTKAVLKDKKGAAKNARLLKNLGVTEEEMSSIADSSAPVRQSRRLAQIKIKEEATRRDDDEVSTKKKKKKSDDKDFKVGKRKRIEEEVKPAPTPPMVEKKKKKKTKPKKISIGWRSSSEDSDNSCQEEEEVSEYEEHHEEEPLQFKSDHEFSPESDLEGDEPLPLKRARTVRKEESDDGEPEEEFPCQKCGKSDHPEWILLCDKCDNGWHCSCLRPPLFVIPEGDWFCPGCQHDTLVENLNLKLVEYDKLMLKKEMEDRRKERLAYVGISLNNVLPAKDKKDKKSYKSTDSDGSSRENSPSGSDSDESDSDEPIYQLRQRRQAHSYKFQDYDDLINSALEEEPPPEVEKTHTLGRGKDIATIVNAAKEEEEKNGFEDLPPVVPRDPEESRKKAMSYRRKPKRLNNLEVNSEDEADDSDEDFKGSSSDESEEEEYSENSDDSFVGRKSSRPVRRSTRARTTRFDADFINDDSDNGSSRKKKKKKKRYFSDSDSSVSDDWRGKKKSKKSHKKSKKKKVFDDSDLENYRKKKPKIKYGMDSDDDTKGRRTRGKKTSYLDTLGSDSEEETLKKKIKNKSDDEYVAEDDEEKESEEEEGPEVEKPSSEEDEDEDEVNGKKHNSAESDSEEEALVVKKMKMKNKRAIMDSDEEEEEVETEKTDKIEKQEKPPKPTDMQSAIDKELEEAAEEFRKVEEQILEEPKVMPKPPVVPPKDLQQQAVLPGLNVDKLKACGITVTKVAKDKVGIPPCVEDKQSPIKLIEIGAKPIIPVLNQRNNPLTFPPVTLKKLEKNLDELDEDEVEEMMENEEYANRQLELAAIQIRQAKRMKELEEKAAAQPPPVILRKPVDIIPKKPMSGRFFNMKPPQESMLGNSSLLMNDDDNDELSEPPGVTLPLFSELGSMKVHNLSKSNNTTRCPSNNTPPPPLSPSRAVPVPIHNMTRGPPHPLSGNIPMVPPNPFGPSRPPGMMHQMRQTRPMGLRGSNMAPMMTPRGPMPPMDPNHPIRVPPMGINVPGNIPNPARNMTMPPMSSSASIMSNNISMGTSAQISVTPNPQTGSNLRMGLMSSMATPSGVNMTMGSNLPLVPNAHVGAAPGTGASGQNSSVLGAPGPNLPSSINESPDGTPKKRKGRGKGKKTLAAEAAAAAAAAGLPPSESNKTANTKPPVANIEIASPPQPFSQSQPAPSVITRMLQTTPGKGAFPVGRIRPKQFAMMQDSDDNDSPRSVESQEKDMSTIPPPVSHSPVTGSHGGHPPGHYGPPPGQYPPNYYPKDGQPQPPHGFHHQRPAPPPMHPYPPHPSQPPMDTPPMNPPPITQPPISMTDPPTLGQYPAPPPPSKSPYEGMPPHRPPYPNSNPVYNYEYNAPPPVMGGEEGVPPPSYENSSTYPDQYEAGSSNMDPGTKNVDEENSGEFGGLVSYFSSQHEDELEQ